MLASPILRLIHAALAEDVGSGDVTAEYFTPAEARRTAVISARGSGIAAGVEVAATVFRLVDPNIEIRDDAPDGAALAPGSVLLQARGNTRSLLTAERTALNFLGRLCGIATLTQQYVAAVSGAGAAILDTRKTTPGWRMLEKAAVVAGGGVNHRMGLYDRVMVKDNHLLAESRLPDLQRGIDRVKRDRPGILVELEADTLEQVRDFLELRGVDIILLDNMPTDILHEAVRMNAGRCRLEASGGVTLGNVRAIAETGVDFISVGALTHSAPAFDLSLSLEPA
ncbi:MAG TPA: carboxylating nicotinate-nucleotide diphosphorylase [Longimicrobiaceae bacterium]|nr:carboxylating nicotinate-nucleotide diphosphorylase [Longimicrobiaceae bacterium]